jgi:hypothetical protein
VYAVATLGLCLLGAAAGWALGSQA